MEKTVSPEERMRRAEEIYYRRRVQGVRAVPEKVTTRNKDKPNFSLLRKMVLQIAICLVIYFIFYLVKTTDYSFSTALMDQTKHFLTYDINFQNVYEQSAQWFQGIQQKLNAMFQQEQDSQESNNEEVTNIITNEIENVATTEQTEDQGGIGGGVEETVVAPTNENKSQMELDEEYVKQNCSIVWPVKGTITSPFGSRTPTEIVSANHNGLDIGVPEGTVICAAMTGTVTQVSTEGDYGNHIRIQNGDVVTLYAHCKTIYVKEGEQIKQGTQIGEAGHTGRATGPHLHFEIRRENRVMDPQVILGE